MDDNQTRTDDLWQEYQLTRNAEDRNRLVARYFHMVKDAAEHLAPQLPDMIDRDELLGAGALGLMQAIEKFDQMQGAKFETYCAARIRGAMLDELRNLDWMPRLMRSKAHRVRRAFSALVQTLGRIPTDQEVAGTLGLSESEYAIIAKHATSACSLHSLLPANDAGDEELRKIDVLRDDRVSTPAEIIERREVREIVTDLIRSLPSTDRLVILLYYYDRLTMKEIGKVLRITESRICQVHNEVIAKLQRRLRTRKEELVAPGR